MLYDLEGYAAHKFGLGPFDRPPIDSIEIYGSSFAIFELFN